MRALVLSILATLAFAAPAVAQGVTPPPGPVDYRIRSMVYDPGQVVSLAGHLGYQMMIEFGAGERIENISIGDSVSWQVTPNRRANLLFLKPIQRRAPTNMTVVTNLRRYAFELAVYEPGGRNDDLITYSLNFIYPEDQSVAEVEQPFDPFNSGAPINSNYVTTGAASLYPSRVFDDGAFTYFQFPPAADTPAIFVLGADNEEEMVNSQVRGDYTVIDRIAGEFVLRYGRDRARVRRSAAP